MSDPTDGPKLLRIPQTFHSVDEMLECAKKLGLNNAVLLSERENGNLVLLDSGLTMAECNWLLDCLKCLLLEPAAHQKVDR